MIASCSRGSVSQWFCVPPILSRDAGSDLLQFFSTLVGRAIQPAACFQQAFRS
jgi:hypothetical protein